RHSAVQAESIRRLHGRTSSEGPRLRFCRLRRTSPVTGYYARQHRTFSGSAEGSAFDGICGGRSGDLAISRDILPITEWTTPREWGYRNFQLCRAASDSGKLLHHQTRSQIL